MVRRCTLYSKTNKDINQQRLECVSKCHKEYEGCDTAKLIGIIVDGDGQYDNIDIAGLIIDQPMV